MCLRASLLVAGGDARRARDEMPREVPDAGAQVALRAEGWRPSAARASPPTCVPMDSARCFELDFVDARRMANYRVERLLDVSSPRLVPVMMARDRSVHAR